MPTWLLATWALASVTGCSLLYDGDDHQGGVLDGSTGDTGVDAAAQCMADPDQDDDGHDAIACGGDDCDDMNNAVYPGAPEVCGNNRNESCGDATLATALGVTAPVVQHPPRLLFSYQQPRFPSTANFVAPVSMASTLGNVGWFVAATLRHNGTQNEEVMIRATADAPTTFTQISNYIQGPPAFADLVGLAVARDRNTGGDPAMAMMALYRQPDGDDVLGFVGDIDTPGNDIALTNLSPLTTTEDVSFRPGMTMTGGDLPPQWVLGEVGSVTMPDRLGSCREGSASCNFTDSTLGGTSDEQPILAAGSPTGHVFFASGAGPLIIWDPISNGTTTLSVSALIADGVETNGRPSVAEVAVTPGLPAIHHYVVALPYRDAGDAARLALVGIDCGFGQQPAACTAGRSIAVPVGSGSFAGPVAIVGYGQGRFALLVARTLAGTHSLRMLPGSYDHTAVSDPFTVGEERELQSFAASAGALLDVNANYLARVSQPSIVSVVWQAQRGLVELHTTAFSFCQEP
ncbi:MAG: putative metal-binding motif-containing protein [Sandaracinaceae bacterium]|nr:putative metal-binding motif-containing protein [Myxococcales bacterium]MCB9656621.1 putative metal-binding motif-containing protein [Sandaracinaceae bacterium]